jgi:hypothetical protein
MPQGGNGGAQGCAGGIRAPPVPVSVGDMTYSVPGVDGITASTPEGLGLEGPGQSIRGSGRWGPPGSPGGASPSAQSPEALRKEGEERRLDCGESSQPPQPPWASHLLTVIFHFDC